MRFKIREKLVIEKLEKRLKKNERRMQSIAENSYNIRMALEKLYIEQKPAKEEVSDLQIAKENSDVQTANPQ